MCVLLTTSIEITLNDVFSFVKTVNQMLFFNADVGILCLGRRYLRRT